ncbi:GNAT family N-acetyltransferase [Pedobacter rhizosphaerae]|uniref:FR47-like protein n=1 Tax=Pedobacter rhizosphaerae TaxID=390241 RepID=A0A1H9U8M0_9SPHI|nr:GNAT family N-acetyltransferase [Pedobacter rhizosphaerae]SES05588.1 FR47-like protein [Pedobacter rhizosphaerae]
MQHILDNPIYNSLATTHQHYAKGNDKVKFYMEDVTAFAGLKKYNKENFENLHEISPADSLFVIFTLGQVEIPANWKITMTIDMFQMVYEASGNSDQGKSDEVLTDLHESHIPEMTDLVNLTKPGPFLARTIELGNYTGIFKGDQLVSMAGHRISPYPYIEISAVCTHPDHLGNGYSYQILSKLVNGILAQSQTPFLHVRNDNIAAIKLYEKLGFRVRTDMFATVFKKA